MPDLVEKITSIAPKSARPTLRFLAVIIAIAVGSVAAFVWSVAKADAHVNEQIDRKVKPLRYRTARTEIILEHLYEDHEEDRAAAHKPVHSLSDLDRLARQRAKEEEASDEGN